VKTTTAADPATVNLFKAAAAFVDVDGALDGRVEIDEGVMAGASAGEAWGGDGGELLAEAEGEGPLFTGTGADAAVELAEGEIAGGGACDGGVEIDDGVTAGAAVGGKIDGAWDGGVEIDDGATAGAAAGEPDEAVGEGEGALFTGTGGDATGVSAEGERAGDGNGEDLGDDLAATTELSNSATKSINTAVWKEAIVERWRRMGKLGLTI
jgi:hypothetical protein